MYSDIEILEFTKILKEYEKYAATDLGKEKILSIRPTNVKTEIMIMLEEVFTAKTMIERYDETPMTGVLNLLEALKRVKIGATMSIEELLKVVSLTEAEARTERFIKKVRQLEIPSEPLDHYYNLITTHLSVRRAIEECIDQKGQVMDSASPELSQVRKKIGITENRISDKMNSLLQSESGKLTDSLITIRNNRLVLPVKAEFKNQFKGIMHDQSSSKETVFIEPMACVELNNQLQSLFLDEQDAIEKILYRLSQEVAVEADSFLENLRIFTILDVIFAKAKHAIAFNEEKPEIVENEINLKNARHPFIPKAEVVANTISFLQYRTIVITGPNTGGKTVALKTLGLLSIMVQSGMFIPIDSGSKTIVFDNIFADIGDEQSIEQSLSTFSSHITKIINILHKMTPKSLILLDELGSGTDPKEGASLAISILDFIRNKSVYAMVTTHYPELKVYAYNLEDTVNASVEFDIDSLRPTYRLQIGIPGTSNALDIAARLGLNEEIINQARVVSLTFDNDTSNLIKKLERQSKLLQTEIDNYHLMQVALSNDKETLEKTITDAKIKQNKIIKELEAKKREELEKAKQEAMSLIDELDLLRKSATIKEHELARLKFAVKHMDEGDEEYQKTNQKRIHVGDIVNVIPYQRTGIVMKQRNENEYEIQMGSLSSVFQENQLEFVEPQTKEAKRSSTRVQKEGIAHAELDLRGQRYDEAMEALDKYVDDCLFHHLEFASIIHGYGTGALKKGVGEYVKQNKAIKKSRPGGMNEGGQGVTIIYFK